MATYRARPASNSAACSGPIPRIIQSGRDGIYRSDLTVFILAEVGFHAMEDTKAAGGNGEAAVSAVLTPRPAASQPISCTSLSSMVIEGTDGIGTAAYTGPDGIRKPAFLL